MKPQLSTAAPIAACAFPAQAQTEIQLHWFDCDTLDRDTDKRLQA